MNMQEIERALRELRLSGIAATLSTRVLQAQSTQEPFLDTFAAMLQDELDRRRSRLTERRFKHSRLDERPTLADFDWRFNPKLPRQFCNFIKIYVMVNPVILYNKIISMPPDVAEEVNNFVDFVINRKKKIKNKIVKKNGSKQDEILPEGGFGCLKGKIWMSEDFDEPLEDFKEYM